MAFLVRTILLIVVLACLSGCTIHFKGKEIELDVERQRVQNNDSYELEKIELFRG